MNEARSETAPAEPVVEAPKNRRKLRRLSTYARTQGVLPEALAREDELRAMHVLLGTILSLPVESRPRVVQYLVDAAGFDVALATQPKRRTKREEAKREEMPVGSIWQLADGTWEQKQVDGTWAPTTVVDYRTPPPTERPLTESDLRLNTGGAFSRLKSLLGGR